MPNRIKELRKVERDVTNIIKDYSCLSCSPLLFRLMEGYFVTREHELESLIRKEGGE